MFQVQLIQTVKISHQEVTDIFRQEKKTKTKQKMFSLRKNAGKCLSEYNFCT